MCLDKHPIERVQRIVLAQKSHGSLTVTVPRAVRSALGIKRGDILVFDLVPGRERAEFYKLKKGLHRG